MNSYDITLCANTGARQVDEDKVETLTKILKDRRLSYNTVDIGELPKSSDGHLGSTLMAVGGDGTVNAAADAAFRHRRKLAVIPLGTFNHFAKDLGLPLSLEEAGYRAVAGKGRRVDAGQVNGKLFLNNSVIGTYPHLVANRDEWQGKVGKWLATLFAAITMLYKFRIYHLQLQMDNSSTSVGTNLLMVANNQYNLDKFGLGERNVLDQGELVVYVLKPRNRVSMIMAGTRLLLGRLRPNDFDQYHTKAVKISSNKRALRVAVDGESLYLKTPLSYKSLPQALTVVV